MPPDPLRKYALCQFRCSENVSPPPPQNILYETLSGVLRVGNGGHVCLLHSSWTRIEVQITQGALKKEHNYI